MYKVCPTCGDSREFDTEQKQNLYFTHCQLCRKEVVEFYPDPIEPVIMFYANGPIDFSTHRTVAELNQDYDVACKECNGLGTLAIAGQSITCNNCKGNGGWWVNAWNVQITIEEIRDKFAPLSLEAIRNNDAIALLKTRRQEEQEIKAALETVKI